MFSYLIGLECTLCHRTFPCDSLTKVSPCCSKVLFPLYDLPRLKREVDREVLATRPADMWRYHELLPVNDQKNVISLGEGGTPLLRASRLGKKLGLEQLFIKDEGLNPTGSFKARGISAAVSKAR